MKLPAIKARAKRALQRRLYSSLFTLERMLAPGVPDTKPAASVAAGGAHPLFGRICLVKQDVYNDLYCCRHGANYADLVRSSLKRSGPAALFSELGADFRIVRTEDTPECRTWQQKAHDCHQSPLDYYYGLQTYANPRGENAHACGQSDFAVSAESVDWSRYDVVLSLDVAVPTSVTRRHPRTVWGYWVSEPCMRTYRASHFRPVPGYDIFLNQRFWEGRVAFRRAHELNFPYAFLKSGCLAPLAGEADRRGTMIESHTKHLLSAEQFARLREFGPVRLVGGTIGDIVAGLHASRYWVRLGGRSLWGNGMAEAIACGCLALGDPAEFKNRSLFTPETCTRSFEETMAKISRFEADAVSFETQRRIQQQRLDHFCFQRPLDELTKFVECRKRADGVAISA